TQKLTEMASLEAKLMGEQHKLHQEMLSVLTAEQKAQLEQSRAQFKTRRGEMRKHGSDLDLARQAQDGDESAFAEIVRRYSPRVFSVASRFFRQRTLVEEAAQEVFLKAYTQLGSFKGRGSLEGWLTRIATNTCLNMVRGAKRRPELTVSDLTEDEESWLEHQSAGNGGEPASVENSLV